MENALLWFIYLAISLLVWRFLVWKPRSVPGITRAYPLLLGHRGVRGIKPENTTEAFTYAFQAGLDGIECDVQRTSDGELVLFHDFELAKRRLTTLTFQQIQDLDPQIPTLKALFEISKAYPGTLLNLELKTDRRGTDGLERACIQAIRASGMADRIIISSFNPLALLRVRLMAPDLRLGLLYAPDMPAWLRSGFLAGWLHTDAIHPHESQVTPRLLQKCAVRHTAINTWTVNEPKRIRNLYQQGVTGIIGDDPEILKQASQKP